MPPGGVKPLGSVPSKPGRPVPCSPWSGRPGATAIAGRRRFGRKSPAGVSSGHGSIGGNPSQVAPDLHGRRVPGPGPCLAGEAGVPGRPGVPPRHRRGRRHGRRHGDARHHYRQRGRRPLESATRHELPLLPRRLPRRRRRVPHVHLHRRTRHLRSHRPRRPRRDGPDGVEPDAGRRGRLARHRGVRPRPQIRPLHGRRVVAGVRARRPGRAAGRRLLPPARRDLAAHAGRRVGHRRRPAIRRRRPAPGRGVPERQVPRPARRGRAGERAGRGASADRGMSPVATWFLAAGCPVAADWYVPDLGGPVR